MNFGADWWKVVCVSEADGQATVYYSNPDNYRSIIEAFEMAATWAIAAAGAVAGAFLGFQGASSAGAVSPSLEAALTPGYEWGVPGEIVGKVAAEAVNINLEKTSDDLSNYWMFNLKTVDDGQIVSIALNPNMTMDFESKSGHDSTRLSNITKEAFEKVAESVDEAYRDTPD
ncbi:hypothetical protein EsDP_00001369 [Epichloe bromicola]|uniref:Up-regulated in Daf-2 domain-containing protein n=1 Tax=Epichloe bromicola TaxID=79588 RepID=A0ABQ0CHN4_9HYPO